LSFNANGFYLEVMDPLSQLELKKRITLLPAHPPRAVALQERIQIGVGYHNKWYRSQKEHWLGWIVVKEYKAILKDIPLDTITARMRWSRLNCIPMMFWLAEVAGVDDDTLTEAEEAAILAAQEIPQDCPLHGKIMRQVLPWKMIEKRMIQLPSASSEEAASAGNLAFEHLASIKPKRRELKEQVLLKQNR
jgi:hypothetical protein